MVVVMDVRPASARATAADGAGVDNMACEACECMDEEKHATRGGCQALRRNKAKDFRWMQLKPMVCALQHAGHEDAVGVLGVIAERRTRNEACAGVKRTCRREVRH